MLESTDALDHPPAALRPNARRAADHAIAADDSSPAAGAHPGPDDDEIARGWMAERQRQRRAEQNRVHARRRAGRR